MQSEYLREIGAGSYICNWLTENDEEYEKYKEYEKVYGVFPPANWDFDTYFARWLYCYLKDYLKDADQFVDLDFYHFNFKGKNYSEKQAIMKILDVLKTFIKGKNKITNFAEEKAMFKNYQEAIHLFAEILPSLWW